MDKKTLVSALDTLADDAKISWSDDAEGLISWPVRDVIITGGRAVIIVAPLTDEIAP